MAKPLDFLGENSNKKLKLHLKNGIVLTGTIEAFDIHLNVVLTNAEIFRPHLIKATAKKILIRGDMVMFVTDVDSIKQTE
jgi:small nuclear ribonucleoprotein (snRNP)-like protein